MLTSVLVGCLLAAGSPRPTTSQPTSQPVEWGELSRWLRIAAVVDASPTAGRPLRVSVWAEAPGSTARLLPEEVTSFCILASGQQLYFSQRLSLPGPIVLKAGEPTRLMAVDLLEQRFFRYESRRFKLVDGYPTPREGEPPAQPAGRGRNLLKIGRHAMRCCVYVTEGDGRPADLARALVRFTIAATRPEHLTGEQQAAYDRLAPKFRLGVVSASQAAGEAVQTGAAAVPTLRVLLEPAEPDYARQWATDSLCKIVDPAAAAALREMIRRPELGSRSVMAYHLMHRRDAEADGLIVELLQATKGNVPHLWIARGFVDCRRAFRGKAAELLLTSRSPKVLYLCGMALNRGALKKSDTQRIFDLRGDEQLREQAAVALIDGLDRADAKLKPHVYAALARLTGMKHETDAAWQAWKKRHAETP